MDRAAARKKYMGLCLVLLIAGCAADRVAPEGAGTSGTVEVLVRGVAYDDKGLPVIGPALAERPSGFADHFSVVRLADGRPVISYDIVVTRRKPDFMKPLQAVYEWTGKGFMLGAHISGALAYGAAQAQPPRHNDEAALELAIVFTPLVIGTVGGFAVGLADGIRQTALELGKVVTSGEQALTCTIYEYDAMDRLWFMHMLTPDRARELVRTEFVYEGAGTRPSRTVVRSLVEGKERVIE